MFWCMSFLLTETKYIHCLCTDRSKSLPGEVLGAVKVRELRVIERMNSLSDSYPYKKCIAILKCREEKYIYHLKTLNLDWCYVIGTFAKTENGAIDSLVLVNKTYDVSPFFLAMPVGRCTSLWEPVDFLQLREGEKSFYGFIKKSHFLAWTLGRESASWLCWWR